MIQDTYDIFTLEYGSGDQKVQVPLDPNYLIPLMKNDQRAMSAYSGNRIQNISGYKFMLPNGDIETINVSVNNVKKSITEFITEYIYTKHSSDDEREIIKKILSICSYNTSVLFSVLYLLYVNDSLDILKSISEDNIDSEKIYTTVMNELNKQITKVAKIDIEDYIPELQSTELDLSNMTLLDVDFEVPFKIGNDYENAEEVKISGYSGVFSSIVKVNNKTDIYDSISQFEASGNFSEQEYSSDPRAEKCVYELIDKSTPDTYSWSCVLNGFPTCIQKVLTMGCGLKIDYSNYKHLKLTLSDGFAFKIRYGLFYHTRSIDEDLEITSSKYSYIKKNATQIWDKYKFDNKDTLTATFKTAYSQSAYTTLLVDSTKYTKNNITFIRGAATEADDSGDHKDEIGVNGQIDFRDDYQYANYECGATLYLKPKSNLSTSLDYNKFFNNFLIRLDSNIPSTVTYTQDTDISPANHLIVPSDIWKTGEPNGNKQTIYLKSANPIRIKDSNYIVSDYKNIAIKNKLLITISKTEGFYEVLRDNFLPTLAENAVVLNIQRDVLYKITKIKANYNMFISINAESDENVKILDEFKKYIEVQYGDSDANNKLLSNMPEVSSNLNRKYTYKLSEPIIELADTPYDVYYYNGKFTVIRRDTDAN